MSGEQEVDRSETLLLTREDRANGFSIVADDRHNIRLLKGGKPVAWFSAAVTEEVLREFLELVKDCERSAKAGQCKRYKKATPNKEVVPIEETIRKNSL